MAFGRRRTSSLVILNCSLVVSQARSHCFSAPAKEDTLDQIGVIWSFEGHRSPVLWWSRHRGCNFRRHQVEGPACESTVFWKQVCAESTSCSSPKLAVRVVGFVAASPANSFRWGSDDTNKKAAIRGPRVAATIFARSHFVKIIDRKTLGKLTRFFKTRK